MKISIIGAGHVGSTLAYTLILKGLPDELVLIDKALTKAKSDALDMTHSLSFLDRVIPIMGGEIADSRDSDIIVITASVPWQKEYKTRFDLGPGNTTLFKELLPDLARLSPKAILVVVTNPLDVMTWFAIKYSGFPHERVFGIGTLIDSARFRVLLSQKYHIHPDDIRAYILGEHGGAQFAAISAAYIGGVKIRDTETIEKIMKVSEISAYDIFLGKGYTNYAISQAATLVIESIVKNEKRTIPLSTLIEGYLGISDVCLSIPVVVGREGVTRKLHIDLNEKEQKLFRESAKVVKDEIGKLL